MLPARQPRDDCSPQADAGGESAVQFPKTYRQALERMSAPNGCLFITGKAGTGKSTLLAHFCDNAAHKPVVLAPTGVAALNVKGQTIHRFFNFPVDVTTDAIRSGKVRPRDTSLYHSVKTIIIDEASMLRADLLDCIHAFLERYGPLPHQPFGGVRMIFVGDLYQLPPVVAREEQELFRTFYETPYFFSAGVLAHTTLEVIELDTIFRQKDQRFIELLGRIRNNSVEEEDLALLASRHMQVLPSSCAQQEEAICLTTTNRKADEVNEARLAALSGKLHRSEARISGEITKEYYPTATTLHYKVGAQIMLLNNDQKKRWVNGSIGTIEAIRHDEEGEEYLSVRLHENGKKVPLYPYLWEVFRFSLHEGAITSQPMGSFTQYPFRLAWAVTIHKSQGKTFDRVVIDLGRGTFASGQLYVALSRCTSLEGITLTVPVARQHIRTDPRIYRFLTAHHYRLSEEALPLEEKIALIERVITQGGELEMEYLKANDVRSSRRVRPLSVGTEHYQGKAFPGMRAWCTQRGEERMFHVQRILRLHEVPRSE